MAQSEFPSDASSSASGLPPAPPVTGMGEAAPRSGEGVESERPPQVSRPPQRSAPPRAARLAESARPDQPPVPPPPPPRSAPPPVRPPVAEPVVPSGVGSARAPRWRGELEPLESPRRADDAERGGGDAAEPHGEHDPIVRSAPPWLISTVMHLILLLALALISTPAGDQLKRVVLTIGNSEQQSPVELSEFDLAASEPAVEPSEAAESSPMEIESPELFDPAEFADAVEPVPMQLGAAEPAAAAPAMFGGRSGAMKEALLAMYGGTPKTQDAVAEGLAWLKRNQRPGGQWSLQGPYSDGAFSENEIAATAMALLAFLGDGHTHRQGEYSAEVENGLKYLIQQQRRDGFLAASVRRDQHQTYAQAQATIALCEAYAMTKDSWLRPHAQAALDYADDAQSPEGGWRYRARVDSDTSVTGWYVMGLQSGRSAGLDVAPSIFDDVAKYLDTVESFDGAAYAYKPHDLPSPSMTAEGLLCRQYLGWDRDHPPLIRGVDALLIDAPFDIRDRDVYYWYYATQVLHHFGGSPWRQWNNAMREQLPEAQVQRGRERGSWAPQGDAYQSAGRLYTTCLSIYCLEVYYRHMPLYGHGEQAAE